MDPAIYPMSQDAEMALEENEQDYVSSSPGSSSQTSTLTWINWFTSLPGHDYYCEVHEEYIEDDFNLTGLQNQVPFWKEALEMVLDVEPEEDSLTIPDVSIIESSAELLYGLVHQRFILTKAGLQAMAERYEVAAFGVCPRVFCYGQAVLPCGRADTPGLDTVKLFCPNCQDIYSPLSQKYSGVDGAFFGSTFPTLFFQAYPEFLSMPFKGSATTNTAGSTDKSSHTSAAGTPQNTSLIQQKQDLVNPNPYGGQRPPSSGTYVPRIYGFKVSERAKSGPRMGWLRERPERYEELDEVDWKGRPVVEDKSGDKQQKIAPTSESAAQGGGGGGSGNNGVMQVEKSGTTSALFEEDAAGVPGGAAVAGLKSEESEEEEE